MPAKSISGRRNPLAELTDSLAVPFPDGYSVNTDLDGTAVLRGTTDACTIYVFRTTTLMKTACEPGTYAGSNVSCVEEGSALYNQCSGHVVITPSGVAEHRDTTLSVTYLPERQITLYLAVDGAVDIRPLRKLGDFTQPSAPVRLEEGQFFYTAPDDHATTIAGTPMRVATPLDEIAPLASDLGLQEMLLDTQDSLDKQGIPVEVVPPEMIPPVLNVRLAGGPLETTEGRNALFSAAPWADIADEVYPFVGLELIADNLDQTDPMDIREFVYDQAVTRNFLDTGGYPNGLPLTIYFPAGDDYCGTYATRLADALLKSGVMAKVVAAPGEQIMEFMRANLDAGLAAVWLELDLAGGAPVSR